MMDLAESTVESAVAWEDKKARVKKAILKTLKPKGYFKQNPPLLEAKRIEHAIPNGCWNMQMVFDRILIWQIPEDEGGGAGGTSIVLPEQSADRAKNQAPRGIIVNAGASALDGLRANGIDLGHTIFFLRNAPWHVQVDAIDGHFLHAIILRTGDIMSSEELAASMTSGKARIEYKETKHDDGVVLREHHYVDEDGVSWHPINETFQGDDF